MGDEGHIVLRFSVGQTNIATIDKALEQIKKAFDEHLVAPEVDKFQKPTSKVADVRHSQQLLSRDRVFHSYRLG
jgi:tetrahydromethanopterin S-methyltransferase subunit F